MKSVLFIKAYYFRHIMQRIIAFILVVILTPVFLITALIAGMGSGLPMIFVQERLGINKEPFTIYKFKTMKNGKITSIGSILRKTGLDELPQLFNIIEGKMRFVGPRPLTQDDIDRLEWNSNTARLRWSVHPGITGMAQLVNVCDKNISLKNDILYAKQKSTSLDLKIFWKSLLVPILGKSNAKSILHNQST